MKLNTIQPAFGSKSASHRVGRGVGSGLLSRGQPMLGSRFAAGEIGHVCAVPEGRTCGCGRRGARRLLARGSAVGRGALVRGGSSLIFTSSCGKAISMRCSRNYRSISSRISEAVETATS